MADAISLSGISSWIRIPLEPSTFIAVCIGGKEARNVIGSAIVSYAENIARANNCPGGIETARAVRERRATVRGSEKRNARTMAG